VKPTVAIRAERNCVGWGVGSSTSQSNNVVHLQKVCPSAVKEWSKLGAELTFPFGETQNVGSDFWITLVYDDSALNYLFWILLACRGVSKVFVRQPFGQPIEKTWVRSWEGYCIADKIKY
jgi:hypothetical protein